MNEKTKNTINIMRIRDANVLVPKKLLVSVELFLCCLFSKTFSMLCKN